MSSENKVDVREFLPVNFGWLKMSVLLACVCGWITFVNWFVYYPYQTPRTINSAILISMLTVSVLGSMLLSSTRITKFVRRYLRNNIIGNVSCFYVDESQTLSQMAFTSIYLSGWPQNQIFFYLPLGGWFQGKPKLFILKRGDLGSVTFEECYHWKFKLQRPSHAHFDDCGTIRLYVQDFFGNRLNTTLEAAMLYLNVPLQQTEGLEDFFAGFPAAKKRLAEHQVLVGLLAALVESAILDIEKSRRFGKTDAGMAIKYRLDAKLAEIYPGYQRRYQEQSRAVS